MTESRTTYVKTFDDGSYEIVDAGTRDRNERLIPLLAIEWRAELVGHELLVDEVRTVIQELKSGEWDDALSAVDAMIATAREKLGEARWQVLSASDRHKGANDAARWIKHTTLAPLFRLLEASGAAKTKNAMFDEAAKYVGDPRYPQGSVHDQRNEFIGEARKAAQAVRDSGLFKDNRLSVKTLETLYSADNLPDWAKADPIEYLLDADTLWIEQRFNS